MLSALVFSIAAAATIAPARVNAVSVPASARAVRAGGELSEDVWRTATPADAFVQREPEEGGKPSQRTGSTLFVVWQQARENDAVPGGFNFGRDVQGIFGVARKNVFLVKLAYWLNY